MCRDLGYPTSLGFSVHFGRDFEGGWADDVPLMSSFLPSWYKVCIEFTTSTASVNIVDLHWRIVRPLNR